MDGLNELRTKTKSDITIAFTRSGRKCWLLKPTKEMPFREQITPMLSRRAMAEHINKLLQAAEGGRQ